MPVTRLSAWVGVACLVLLGLAVSSGRRSAPVEGVVHASGAEGATGLVEDGVLATVSSDSGRLRHGGPTALVEASAPQPRASASYASPPPSAPEAPAFAPIAGRVLDMEGLPLEGVDVSARHYSAGEPVEGPNDTHAVTGEDGRFHMERFPKDAVPKASLEGYLVVAATYVKLSADGTYRDLEFRMAPTGVLRLSILMPDGSPPPTSGAFIDVAGGETWGLGRGFRPFYSRQDASWEGPSHDIEAPASVPLVISGASSSFHRMENGRALLGEGPHSNVGDAIMLEPGATVELTIQLAIDVTIQGQLVHGPGTKTPGRPVTDGEVRVLVTGEIEQSPGLHASLATDAFGRFEYRHATCEPTCQITFEAKSPGPRPGATDSVLVGRSEVTVGGTDEHSVTVTLDPSADRSLIGRVFDSEDAPVSTGSVHLVPAEPEEEPPTLAALRARAIRSVHIQSSSSRAFIFRNVDPGDYWLFAQNPTFAPGPPKRVHTGDRKIKLAVGVPLEARVRVSVHSDAGAPSLLHVDCFLVSPDASDSAQQAATLLGELKPNDFRAALAEDALNFKGSDARHSYFSWSPRRGEDNKPAVECSLPAGLYILHVGGWPAAPKQAGAERNRYGVMSTGVVRIEAGDHEVRVPMPTSHSIQGRIDWGALPVVERSQICLGFHQGNGLVRLPGGPFVEDGLIHASSRGSFHAMMVPSGTYEAWLGTAEELHAGRPRSSTPVTIEAGMDDIVLRL